MMFSLSEEDCRKILDNAAARNSDGYRITVCGRFDSGKSSVINALIGQDLLPTKITTSTAVVTRIAYGSEPEAYILHDGRRYKTTVQEARKFIQYVPGKESQYKIGDEVHFYLPHPLLKDGVTIIDTPGLDDNVYLDQISMHEIDNTHLAFIVYNAWQFNALKDKELCERLNHHISGNIACVVNKVDLLMESDMQNLLEAEEAALKHIGNDLIGRRVLFNTCALPGSIALNGLNQWLSGLVQSGKIKKVAALSDYTRRMTMAEEGIAIIESNKTYLKDEIALLEQKQHSMDKLLKAQQNAAVLKITQELTLQETNINEQINGRVRDMISELLGDVPMRDFRTSARNVLADFYDGYVKLWVGRAKEQMKQFGISFSQVMQTDDLVGRVTIEEPIILDGGFGMGKTSHYSDYIGAITRSIKSDLEPLLLKRFHFIYESARELAQRAFSGTEPPAKELVALRAMQEVLDKTLSKLRLIEAECKRAVKQV
jgi:GTPase SAR1 family protein